MIHSPQTERALTLVDEILLVPAHGRWEFLDQTIVAATLRELEIRGRIRCEKKRVTVLDPAPVGDRTLDAALTALDGASKPRSTARWIDHGKLQKLVLTTGREQLVARGELQVELRRALGLVPLRSYHPAPERKQSIVERVRAAYRDGVDRATAGDPRLVDLLVLIRASGMASLFFDERRERKAAREQPPSVDIDAGQSVIAHALHQAVRAQQARHSANVAGS